MQLRVGIITLIQDRNQYNKGESMKNVKGQNMGPSKPYGYRKLGNLNKKPILEQPKVFAPVKDVTYLYKNIKLTLRSK